MPVHVTLMYKLQSGGPKSPGSTEPWYYLGAAESLLDPALHSDCEALINARTEICGDNIYCIGYRVNFPGVPRASYRRLSGTVLGSNIKNKPVISQGSSDIANSALQVEIFSASLQRSNKYLAGLPDAFITTATPGGPDFAAPGLVNYQAKWDSWKAIVLNGKWGFKARAPLVANEPVAITSWTNQTDAPYELVMGVASADGHWDVGDIIHVKHVLMSSDQMDRPIGKWRVRSWSDSGVETLYVLRNSGAFDAAQIEEPGTAETVGYAYVAAQSVDPANQTSRKRGVGPVRPRGRSSRRRRRQAI